jgi:matrixin
MRRRLAALASSSPGARRRPRHSERLRAVSVFVVAVALVAGAWRLGLITPSGQLKTFGRDAVAAPILPGSAGPGLHVVDQPSRLLPPVHGPGGVGGFAVTQSISGHPLRFDPCVPVDYVVSGTEPFPGANTSLRAAIAELSTDTGLRFVDRGTTKEPASPGRSSYQPERYGKRFAPVLIAWTSPEAVPDLKGDVVGLGGGQGVFRHGEPRYVSGIVYFDAPDLLRIVRQQNGPAEVHEIALHELGHLVGLDHVSSNQEVMYAHVTSLPHYGVGDRRGLAELGAGACSNWL